MKCPKCGNDHAIQLMVWMDGRDILKCEKCGQQYMFPAEVPKMTNGDKFRQKTNEEFAREYVQYHSKFHLYVARLCPLNKQLWTTHEEAYNANLEWLNSEVKNESRR